ncbi:alpha/beta hydrolase [Leifsonia sp. NPDC058292]|uniref:alpha/beta hydrolase n=1 Tax=Leifsonia sp. NPDC058292 TaxID=3346428 RepID=UPI0036DD9EDB
MHSNAALRVELFAVLASLGVDQSFVLVALGVVAAALAVYLLVRPTVLRVAAGVGSAVVGALLGFVALPALAWAGLASVPNSGDRTWTTLGCAAVGLAVANLFRSRWPRKTIAVVAILAFAAAALVAADAQPGATHPAASASPPDPRGERGQVADIGTDYASTWSRPASVPVTGELRTVHMAAPSSHFPARDAKLYLPPAALVDDPPVLPVVYAFGGQPGQPNNMFASGHLAATMDAVAAANGGIAPIVIAADQLSRSDRNPMCVDSPLGNSADYLLHDVRAWIVSHFRVSSDPAAWSIIGFSQGATCAVQFASGHPEMFGSALAVASQLAPTLGDDATTIKEGFGGSAAAYGAAGLTTIMRAHAPYADSVLVLGVGQNDAKYTPYAKVLASAATASGMHVKLLVSPGTTHDWFTVRYVISQGFPIIAAHLGLRASALPEG